MRIAWALGAVVLIVTGGSVAHAMDDVEAAYYICAVMDGSGVLSDECEVSGWDQSVTVSIDTTGSEARKMCAAVVEMMASKHDFTQTGWNLRIKSPYTGDNTLANCPFK